MNGYSQPPMSARPQTQKKKLSALSIISMIGAMLFAVAAACMVLLPVATANIPDESLEEDNRYAAMLSAEYKDYYDRQMQGAVLLPINANQENPDKIKINTGIGGEQEVPDIYGNFSTFDFSAIGKSGSNFFKGRTEYLNEMSKPIEERISGYQFMNETEKNEAKAKQEESEQKQNTVVTFMLIEVIAATVAFFGLILVALCVIIGKALQMSKGGRRLALIFSIIGAVIGIGYLVTTILYQSQLNSFYEFQKSISNSSSPIPTAAIGVGPILICVFSVLTLVFCCLGMGKSAYAKAPAAPARPMMPVMNPGMAPDMNSGVSPYAPPAAPQSFAPPVPPAPVEPSAAPAAKVAPPAPAVPSAPPAPAPKAAAADDDPPTRAQLGVIEGIRGDYEGAVINMRPNEKLVIGRDPTCCNIVISSEKRDISRTHCSVKYDPYNDCFKIIDMSSNGTFVNGQRLMKDQELQLASGTVISLGSGENQFRLRRM